MTNGKLVQGKPPARSRSASPTSILKRLHCNAIRAGPSLALVPYSYYGARVAQCRCSRSAARNSRSGRRERKRWVPLGALGINPVEDAKAFEAPDSSIARYFRNELLNHAPILFFICLCLLLVKSPDAVLRPQLWAEDGSVFYAEQFGIGWPLLFVPYAGYMNFIPRLIAWSASAASPRHIPLIYNLIAILINAGIITYAVKSMTPLFGAAVALSAFFLTPTIGDIFGTITNIQWFAQFALIFAVAKPSLKHAKNGFSEFFNIAFIVAASLSGPFSVIDVIAIFTLWSAAAAARAIDLGREYVKSARAIISDIAPRRFSVLCLGAIIQLATMLRNGIRTPDSTFHLTTQELESFGFLNYHSIYVEAIAHPFGGTQLALLTAYVGVFIFAILAMLSSFSSRDIFIVLLLSIGAGQPVMAYAKQHALHPLSSVSHYYYFLGVIALCSAVSMLRERPGKYREISIAAVYAFVLLFLIRDPKFFIRPQLTDMHWLAFAAKISAGERNVVVPLNPGWRAVIDADQR